jgi:hypothetical protein
MKHTRQEIADFILLTGNRPHKEQRRFVPCFVSHLADIHHHAVCKQVRFIIDKHSAHHSPGEYAVPRNNLLKLIRLEKTGKIGNIIFANQFRLVRG